MYVFERLKVRSRLISARLTMQYSALDTRLTAEDTEAQNTESLSLSLSSNTR